MTQNALFSSASVLWGTPPELFRLLDDVFDFQLDAASTSENRLCPHYFTEEQNGLAQDWRPYRRVWLNPPYGKSIGLWMQKAYEEAQKGCLVVCLVPARVATKWWHNWVEGKGHVIYPKGRLRYLNYASKGGERSGGAPFPSALVFYGPSLELRKNYSIDPVVPKSPVPPMEYKSLCPGTSLNACSPIRPRSGRPNRKSVSSARH